MARGFQQGKRFMEFFVYYALAAGHPCYVMALRLSRSLDPHSQNLSRRTLVAWDHAKLLHEGRRINHQPMVNNLPVLHLVGDMDWNIP